MRPAPTLLLLPLALTGLLAACSDDGGDGTQTAWYRAEEAPVGWLIARADPEADSCHLLRMSSLGVPTYVFEDVDVNAEGVYAGGLYDSGDARGCQTNTDNATQLFDATAFGEIRLEQTSLMNGLIHACRLDIDVTATGVRFLVDDLYVWGSGCEPWPSDTTDYTNLHAAYLPDGKTLVLAGWEPTTEACAWINFDILPDPLVPPAIAAPTNWAVDNAIVATMTEDECDAASLGAGGYVSEWVAVGRDEWGAGTLSFTDSQAATVDGVDVDLPCAVSIDAWVPFFGTHYWVPQRGGFKAQNVPVAGTCS